MRPKFMQIIYAANICLINYQTIIQLDLYFGWQEEIDIITQKNMPAKKHH